MDLPPIDEEGFDEEAVLGWGNDEPSSKPRIEHIMDTANDIYTKAGDAFNDFWKRTFNVWQVLTIVVIVLLITIIFYFFRTRKLRKGIDVQEIENNRLLDEEAELVEKSVKLRKKYHRLKKYHEELEETLIDRLNDNENLQRKINELSTTEVIED